MLAVLATLFSGTALGQSLTLEWDPNTEPDIAGYNLYRSDTSGSGYTRVNPSLIADTWYTDSSIAFGNTYYYVCTAENTTGLESEYSNQVVFTAQAPNTPPVANDDSDSTQLNVGVTIDVLANDTDQDGDRLEVTGVTQPALGSTTFISASVHYTPPVDFFGVETFSYSIRDEQGGTDSAIVAVEVLRTNQAPSAVNDAVSVQEDRAVTVNVTDNDSDPDGDPLTVIAAGSPQHGSSTVVSASSVLYTPSTHYRGSDSFTYTIDDGHGGTDSATVTVTVGSAPTDAGHALEFDGQEGYVKIADTTTVMQGAGWESSKTFSVWVNATASEGSAVRPETGDLIVGIDRPRIFGLSRAVSGGEDRYWAFNHDADGVDCVGVSLVPGEWVQISVVHDGATLRLYRNGIEAESVPSGPTVTQDGRAVGSVYFGGSDNARARHFQGQMDEIRLWNVALDVGTIQNWAYRGVDTSHPDWANLGAYYRMSDGLGTMLTDDGPLGNGASLLGAMGDHSWVPSGAFGGVSSIPPVAESQSLTTAEDTPLAVTLTGSDLDGDALAYVVVRGPSHGVLSGMAPDLVYTPAPDFSGVDGFQFVVEDATATSPQAEVSITVTSVNDVPVANPRIVMAVEDTPLWITLTGSDSDGDALEFMIVRGPSQGTLSGTAPDFVYTPAADFFGVDGFWFVVEDGIVASPQAEVSITVSPVNDYPVAVSDTAVTPLGTPITVSVMENDGDIDGDLLTVTGVGSALSGTVTNLGDAVSYTPDSGFSGTDGFIYTISDGNGGTASAPVEVTVTNELILEEAGHLLTPGDAWAVTVSGSLAYVADVGKGLRIVDVSDPSYPVEIGSHDTNGRTYAVEVVNGHAYLADGRDGLVIVDVSNPYLPFEVGRVDTPEFAWGIAVDLPYVYVADRFGGVRIIDAADSANPVEIGSLETPGHAMDIVLHGDVAFVADYSGGLRIIDISGPSNPVERNSVNFGGDYFGLFLEGEYLYVAGGQAGLRVMDVGDPLNPVEVAFVVTPGLARSVSLMGGYALVTGEAEGLEVIDVFEPLNPVWIANVDTPGRARGVTASDGYAYVADHEGGLRVIRVY